MRPPPHHTSSRRRRASASAVSGHLSGIGRRRSLRAARIVVVLALGGLTACGGDEVAEVCGGVGLDGPEAATPEEAMAAWLDGHPNRFDFPNPEYR